MLRKGFRLIGVFRWLLLGFICLVDQPAASGPTGANDYPTGTWLIHVARTDDAGALDSLQMLAADNDLVGVVYSPVQNLETIALHLQKLQGVSQSTLLAGIDMRNFDDTNSSLLGFAASWQALEIAADSALTAQEADAQARLLLDAGIDFVVINGLGLSPTARTSAASLHAVFLKVYINSLKDAGLDVIVDVASDPASSAFFDQSEIRGLAATLPPSVENSKKAVRDLAAGIRKNVDPTILTLLCGAPWIFPKDKAMLPAADMLVISPQVSMTALLEAAQATTPTKSSQRKENRIAQWKMERLVLRESVKNKSELALNPRGHAQQLLLKSPVLLRNQGSLIPFRNLENSSFAATSFGLSGDHFSATVHKYALITDFEYQGSLSDIFNQSHRIGQYHTYIAAIDMGWFGQLNPADQSSFLAFLADLQRRNTHVVAVLIGPSPSLSAFAGVFHVSYHPIGGTLTEQLAPQFLFGAYPYTGSWADEQQLFSAQPTESLARLKYGEPWQRGFDEKKLTEIDEIVTQAIKIRAMPGCQVLIAQNGMVIFDKAYGYLSYDSVLRVTDETLYDLASVTKVGATLQMLMKLQEEGKVDLNESLGTYLPETRGSNKEHLLVGDVLLHRAGLQVHIPFWEKTYSDKRKKINDSMYFSPIEADGFTVEVLPGMYSTTFMRDSIWQWTLQSRLLKLQAEKSSYPYKYSDLGFIVIQRLIETVAGGALNELVSRNFYQPLGISRLCFQPLCQFEYPSIAPTEFDYYFRKEMVWGTVHDQNASLIGGVAGQAGLFGSANSLAILLQMQLQKGFYGGRRYFEPSTVELFTKRISPTEPRAYGWDLKDLTLVRKNTSFWSSETSYGHTGFTGTAVWVDPEHELVYVFLSNRVHPDAKNYKLSETNVRNRIQDVIYQSFGWQIASGD